MKLICTKCEEPFLALSPKEIICSACIEDEIQKEVDKEGSEAWGLPPFQTAIPQKEKEFGTDWRDKWIIGFALLMMGIVYLVIISNLSGDWHIPGN